MPSLKKNILFNMGYQLLILIVPFITSPYVSRVLGPEGLGKYSVTTAIVKYFTLFAMLGMANYGNRMIAKNKRDKETLSIAFWNLFYMQLITSSVVTVVYVFYILVFGMETYGIVCLCQIPYMLSTVFDVSWFFFGMEDLKGIVGRNTIVRILTTVAIFAFVNSRDDVWIYVLINALSLLMGQICLWPFIRKYVVWKRPDWNIIRSHFKPNCVLMVSVLAVSIYTLMSKIMIEILATTTAVGYYENTEKIMTIANNAAGAVGAVMFPRISNLRADGDDKQILNLIGKSMKYIMLLAIALAFGIAGISNCFATVYFGPEFEYCGMLLMTIAPAIVFYAWSNIIRNQYVLPNDMDKVFVLATIIAAVVNLATNILLIPVLGALGAVFGTVASQFIELFYQTVMVRNKLPIKKYIFELVPFTFFGTIMFCTCKLIEFSRGITFATLLIQIIVGMILFVLLSVIYMYYKKDELIMALIKKSRS